MQLYLYLTAIPQFQKKKKINYSIFLVPHTNHAKQKVVNKLSRNYKIIRVLFFKSLSRKTIKNFASFILNIKIEPLQTIQQRKPKQTTQQKKGKKKHNKLTCIAKFSPNFKQIHQNLFYEINWHTNPKNHGKIRVFLHRFNEKTATRPN